MMLDKMTRSGQITVALAAAALLMLSACLKTQHGSSDVQIDSGLVLAPEDANTVDGVVSIGGCTATLVSNNTLITAAHCVGSKPVCVKNKVYNNICSSKIYVNKNYGGGSRMGYDVAVVVYEGTPFNHYFPVALQHPAVNDPVLMVGYSRERLPDASKGSKRWGRNTIESFNNSSRELDSISTLYGGNANKVAVSPGDSGGSMFNAQCQLIGVTSRMSTGGGTKSSYHTNILNQINVEWLASIKQQYGAHYCAPGEVSAQCVAANMYGPVADPGQDNGKPGFPCQQGAAQVPRDPKYINVLLANTASADTTAASIHVAIDGTADRVGICRDLEAAACTAEAKDAYNPGTWLGNTRTYAVYKFEKAVVPNRQNFWTVVIRRADGTLTLSRKIYLYPK